MTKTTKPNDASERKSLREEYSTGWLALTRNDSVSYIIDAVLDLPPRREFNQTELADMAGVSRQSVSRHLDLLVGIGVLEEVDGSSPQRFRFDPESPVSEAIIRLDGAMNSVGSAPDAE